MESTVRFFQINNYSLNLTSENLKNSRYNRQKITKTNSNIRQLHSWINARTWMSSTISFSMWETPSLRPTALFWWSDPHISSLCYHQSTNSENYLRRTMDKSRYRGFQSHTSPILFSICTQTTSISRDKRLNSLWLHKKCNCLYNN